MVQDSVLRNSNVLEILQKRKKQKEAAKKEEKLRIWCFKK